MLHIEKYIDARITALHTLLCIDLVKIKSTYMELTELQKIPFRIKQAEVRALREIKAGVCLDKLLLDCIEQEFYAGAEGIKRAKEFIDQLK